MEIHYLIILKRELLIYGDGIFNSIKEELKRNNVENILEEGFKILHETILQGFDAVKDKIRNEIKITEPELNDEDTLIYGKTGMGKDYGITADSWFTGFCKSDNKKVLFFSTRYLTVLKRSV